MPKLSKKKSKRLSKKKSKRLSKKKPKRLSKKKSSKNIYNGGGWFSDKLSYFTKRFHKKYKIPSPFPFDYGGMMKGIVELVEFSYKFYEKLLRESASKGVKITIICNGHSPAYCSLSMLNLPIYDQTSVEIIIIPHNIDSEDDVSYNAIDDYIKYIGVLREKGKKLGRIIYVLGVIKADSNILSLKEALIYKFSYTKDVKVIALNKEDRSSYTNKQLRYVETCHLLPVYLFYNRAIPKIKKSYRSEDFANLEKFVTEFDIKDDNVYAEIIIDVSKKYSDHDDFDTVLRTILDNTVFVSKNKY